MPKAKKKAPPPAAPPSVDGTTYILENGDRAQMLLQFVASERRATITIEVETGQIRLRTNLNYFIIFTKDRKELILRTGIR